MKKASWDTLAIVGVGLIGGSIGVAALQRGLVKKVVGIGRRESSLKQAIEKGTITESTTDLAAGVSQADLIIVCTPVDRIAEHTNQVVQHCPPGAIITDAGSTKADLVRTIESATPNARFVGSHPLAGSHKSGPTAARADLYVNRTVVVTPTTKTDPYVTDNVSDFWRAIGADVFLMDIDKHDAALAASSHVPHVVAAALASATPEDVAPLVAGGWLDTTRIAGADPALWVPILCQNRQHILASLDQFRAQLDAFRDNLASENADEILRLLQLGKQHRDSIGN